MTNPISNPSLKRHVTPEACELCVNFNISDNYINCINPSNHSDSSTKRDKEQHFIFKNLRFDFFLFYSFLGSKPSVGADLGWVVALVGLWR